MQVAISLLPYSLRLSGRDLDEAANLGNAEAKMRTCAVSVARFELPPSVASQ
jgi:hypothetical protein